VRQLASDSYFYRLYAQVDRLLNQARTEEVWEPCQQGAQRDGRKGFLPPGLDLAAQGGQQLRLGVCILGDILFRTEGSRFAHGVSPGLKDLE